MVMRSVQRDLPAEPLVREERPDPVVTDPHDVVVRIVAAGVCRTDLHLLTGVMEAPLPHVLGHENAGRVHAVGSGVTSVAVGDDVICYPFITSGLDHDERAGRHTRTEGRRTPGLNVDGGYAEYLLTSERSVLRVPFGADLAAMATLTDAGLAAQRACMRAATVLGAGDHAVVIGIGGLGHLAIQILRALTPATILAVDPSPAARELGLEVGAHEVRDPGDLAAWSSCARVVIDLVGSTASLTTSRGLLEFGATYLAVGIGGMLEMPLAELVERELSLAGIFVGTFEDLRRVTALARSGRLVPRVQRYALADANRALHDLAAGRVRGRAVLEP